MYILFNLVLFIILIITPSAYAKNYSETNTWMHHLWSNVDELDENSDGKISRTEYSSYWEKLYSFADVNNDGSITDYEWRLVLEGKKYSSNTGRLIDVNADAIVSSSEANKFWRNQFSQADLNNNGSLSKFETRALLESKLMGVYAEDKDITWKQSSSMDINKDGNVSSDEFLEYWGNIYGDADINNDGKVSAHEYKSMLESKRMEHNSLK